MKDLNESALASERVFEGKLLKVQRDRVRTPDGGEAIREYIIHPGAVMVIPIFENGDLLIERQYRHPMRRVMTEFPAGKIDPKEDPLIAAKRELLEETGYTATHWAHFHTHHPLIAYSTERIEMYVARGLTAGSRQLDVGEFLEIERISQEQFWALFDSGEITDGKTTVGALIAQRQGILG